MDPIQQALEAFIGADSFDKLRRAVVDYPYMTDPLFIDAIERFRQKKVLHHHQDVFEERLGWLRQLAQDQVDGSLS